MNKLSLALIALVGFVLLTGCKKDPAPEPTPTPTYADPTLTLMTGEEYLADGDEIVAGTPFTIGLTGTGETVAKLTVTIKAGEEYVQEKTVEYNSQNTIQYTEELTLNSVADLTMTAVLTDTQDKTVTVTLSFKVVAPSVTSDFEGTYSGLAALNGTAEIQGMASYTLPADTSMLTVQITALEDGTYEGRFVYNDEEHVTTGTLQGETLVFEPFDREVVVEESFTLNLTLTFNFEAKKTEEQLSVSAIVTGTGTVTIPGMPVEMPCSFNGDVAGNLDKTE